MHQQQCITFYAIQKHRAPGDLRLPGLRHRGPATLAFPRYRCSRSEPNNALTSIALRSRQPPVLAEALNCFCTIEPRSSSSPRISYVDQSIQTCITKGAQVQLQGLRVRLCVTREPSVSPEHCTVLQRKPRLNKFCLQ